MSRFFPTAWIGFFIFSPAAFACDFCMLGQGVNPYLTANGRGVTISEDYIQSNQVYDQDTKIDSGGKKEGWLIQSLTGFQAITETLTAMIMVPYASKTNLDSDPATGTPGSLINGLGDITLTARYTLWRHHDLDSTWIAGAIAGLKLPTGNTDSHTSSGAPVDRHALPGTGSTDEILGFSGSYASARGYQFTADIAYNFAGRGKWAGQDHQYGDSLNATFNGYYRVAQSETKDRNYFVFTGPMYEYTGKETGTLFDTGYDSGKVNLSSGGQILFWDIGLYAVFNPNFIVNASFAKALYHNMNYDPNFDPDPAEDYKTNLSVTFLF